MVKVLFLCGSLEPHKDGVGDYVWKLATCLNKLGLSCACISLNDKFVTPKTILTELTDFPSEINRYRISASLTWKDKLNLLNLIVYKEEPFCISFHYVPYAYSSRGVPFRLVNWLPKMSYKCKWHFMFHELWVDPSLKYTNKHLSIVQRLLLKKLVNRISPSVINTSNSYYVRQLLQIGIKSRKLPIFSNIEYIKTPPIARDANTWRFLFFGSIHPEWDHEHLLNAVDSARLKNNISLCSFILIGHAGNYGIELWSRLASRLRSNFNFENLGALSAEEISYQLQIADFGVTTTPSHLVEKSGSVAAMLAHGLPIILPRVTNHLPDFNYLLEQNSSYILLRKGFELELMTSMRQEPVDTLQHSANKFLASLLINK